MNIKQTLLAIIFPALALASTAAEVECVAGSLSSLVNADDTRLQITGTINAADFHFINNKMDRLQALDLSGASIVAYDGEAVLLNRTTFGADMLPDYALAGTTITSLTLPSGLKAIGEGALAASNITTVAIPASVETIGSGAFSGCKALTSITVPATVTTIGTDVFSRCPALTTVVWAAGDIPASAFLGCEALASFDTAGSSAKTVGTSAFAGCSALKAFAFPTALTSIESSAFEASGLEVADMSACTSLTTVGDWAFASCPDLARVTLSPSLTTLGKGALFNDLALATVNIPGGLKELPAYAFRGDTALDVEPLGTSNIMVIGDFALTGLSQVEVFSFPANLEHIGTEAMAGWTSVITLHADQLTAIPTLGDDVWEGVNQPSVTLNVPEILYEAFKKTPQWEDFNVQNVSSSTAIEADIVGTSSVNAWFEGETLLIATDGSVDIDGVIVYNLAGSMFLQAAPHAPSVAFDASGIIEHVYLIGITLSDGTKASIKLAR